MMHNYKFFPLLELVLLVGMSEKQFSLLLRPKIGKHFNVKNKNKKRARILIFESTFILDHIFAS